jgi:hypothetical protein
MLLLPCRAQDMTAPEAATAASESPRTDSVEQPTRPATFEIAATPYAMIFKDSSFSF